jgi:transposase
VDTEISLSKTGMEVPIGKISTGRPAKIKRQRFTPEYKLEAVRLSEEGTKPVSEVAADLGFTANQLHRWRRQHTDRGLGAFPGNGKINSHDEELHRLRRELRQVTEERDFLKLLWLAQASINVPSTVNGLRSSSRLRAPARALRQRTSRRCHR